jgi:hypothetical protein
MKNSHLATTVDELSGVHAFGSNKELLLDLIPKHEVKVQSAQQYRRAILARQTCAINSNYYLHF